MNEEQILEIIFSHSNQEIADKTGDSYSYATYIRHKYKNAHLSQSLVKKLADAFGFELVYKVK